MLQLSSNPYDTFRSVESAMGTKTDPNWLLLFETIENKWTAIDLSIDEDILELALTPNLVSVCLIKPEEIAIVINYAAPQDLCQGLHEWACLSRPYAGHITITDFMPHRPVETPDKDTES